MTAVEPARQTFLMAAIVATLLYVPVGALLGLASFAFFGTPAHAFVTFGGALGPLAGLALWWLAAYLAALAYALLCTPT
jgi:hypothetical protein